jgi:hypothetical protein
VFFIIFSVSAIYVVVGQHLRDCSASRADSCANPGRVGTADAAIAPAAASGPTPGMASAATPRIAPTTPPPQRPLRHQTCYSHLRRCRAFSSGRPTSDIALSESRRSVVRTRPARPLRGHRIRQIQCSHS